MEIQQEIQTLDQLLRSARISEARQLFLKLSKAKIPRTSIESLCQIARRLNEPYVLLKKLRPIIFSEGRKGPQNCTSKELALYAFGLARIGANSEAQEFLNKLPDDLPEKHFYTGLNYVFQWKTQLSIGPLKKYLQFLNPDTYEYFVGEINLISSLLASQQYQIVIYQTEIFLQRINPKYLLLRANCFEIRAQALIKQFRFQEAKIALNNSAELLNKSESKYSLFVKKWNFVINLLENNIYDQNLENELRLFAISGRNFETLRELDYYQCLYFKRSDLYAKLYYGTRSPNYKSRVRTEFREINRNQTPKINRVLFSKLVDPKTTESQSIATIDFSKLQITSKQNDLLKIIFSDFYCPIQLGEVFRRLYPHERFDPYSSVARLYACFDSLKKALHKLNLPFDIYWSNKQVGWKLESSFEYLVPKKAKLLDKPIHLKNLRYRFEQLELLPAMFRIEDIEKIFEGSKRTLHRFLKDAEKSGKITRFRRGVYQQITRRL